MKLIKFIASNFQGECIVDEAFAPLLIQMNTIAINHNMIVIVTSSFRKDANVKNAIVAPAKKSNHMVGHAIDCNLKNKITGEYYDSKKMGDGQGADEIFAKEVVNTTKLKWGEAFQTPDSVHFSDDLNHVNPTRWEKLYNEIKGK